MAASDYQVPDLASVLRTLASFAPPASQDHRTPPPPLSQTPENRQASETSRSRMLESKAPTTMPKVIDPATIIDWSSGLRCVMKTVAANDNVIKEIRRMTKVQDEHEEQWWAGRQDLVKRQATRKESRRKLDEALRAAGGKMKPTREDVNEGEDWEQELKTFDAKVHRAQVQMVKEMSAKLKGFGVPFFGTKSELVRKSREEDKNVEKEGVGEERESTAQIDEIELVELQRRMLEILGDLCRE